MKNTYKKPIIIGLCIGGIILLLRYLKIGDYLTFEQLKQNRMYLMQAVERNYGFSVLVYLSVYILVIACALPVVAPLTILGGFLFGLLPGILYALISCTAGSTGTFLIVRYLFGATVRKKYGDQLARFNERIKSYGYTYLLTLQLLTIIPYFVINTLAALADVPLWIFVWTTVVGAIPLLCIYSFAGQQLHCIESIRDIFSPQIILALVLLALLALLPMLIKRLRKIGEL